MSALQQLLTSINAAAAGGCTTVRDSVTGSSNGVTTDGYNYLACRFTAGASYTTCKALFDLWKTGTWNIQLWSHNAGSNQPSALLATSANNPAVASTASPGAAVAFTSLATALTSATIYWIIFFHSGGGTFSGTNFFSSRQGTLASGRIMVSTNGSTWAEADTGSASAFVTYS